MADSEVDDLARLRTFQLVRMIYHWETPGVYAGWDFLLHFAALAALACFVSLYKPKASDL
ncbi:MAG: KleE stable inheritance protein [Burkholderiaceae bacterium]|nr:KleE stable inheritance protein [Burkholderiaceae bacterium]